MKRILLSMLCLMACNIVSAQEQDLCSMLDIAYNSDNNITQDCWLLENCTYYNAQHFNIKNNLTTKLIYNKKGLRVLPEGFFWNANNNIKHGTIVFETPQVYLYKDTIYIVNNLKMAEKRDKHKVNFFYGPSYYTIFSFDHGRKKWCYAYTKRPGLQSRTYTNEFSLLMERCYYKAIDKCKQSGHEINKIYLIEDYFPKISINDEAYIIPHVPLGTKISKYKKEASCFIGYPKVTFNENIVTITIRIIPQNKIDTMERNLEEMQTVCVKYNFETKCFL